jgi:methyltransferase (TIGR00027 family)
MQEGQPSQTALGAAFHRAAHQVLEGGNIFSDPLAIRILGADDLEAAVRRAQNDLSGPRLRLFIAVRTRFAEESLAASIERGVRQVVVLGAGLDTYAYRASLPGGVRVFEVDHPATQAWKRKRLAEVGISIPPHVIYAPVDFERESLAGGLGDVGFDSAQPTFFTWLGVVPYLTPKTVFSTLGFIARLPGAQVVFDYGNPSHPSTDDAEAMEARQSLAARVASVGEPFRCFFETDELHAMLKGLGFSEIEDLGPELILERYFGMRRVTLRERGGNVLRAAVNQRPGSVLQHRKPRW